MARPRKQIPTLYHHRPSGQAFVRLDGRDVYLGRWDSQQARAAYARLLAELAAGVPKTQLVERPPVEPGGISVAELFELWLDHAEREYVKNGRTTSHVATFKAPLRIARELYGLTPAAEFGPKRLEAVRAKLAEPYQDKRKKRTLRRSRSTLNRQVGLIRAVFRWGVAQELIAPSVEHGLKALAPLRPGRTEAPEVAPVLPVDDATIAATVAELPRIPADMVRLCRLTGMRPGEVCELRPADVDRSRPIWEYRPRDHKTLHKERDRVVWIGPKAQEILRPYLLRAADAYCFSPREAVEELRAERRANRKTPLHHGNRPGRNVTRKPVRSAGDHYTSASFRQAIRRACEAAGVAPWHPNRLRHAFGTEARRVGGLELSQALLGHSRLDVTQVYAEKSEALALAGAARIG